MSCRKTSSVQQEAEATCLNNAVLNPNVISTYTLEYNDLVSHNVKLYCASGIDLLYTYNSNKIHIL